MRKSYPCKIINSGISRPPGKKQIKRHNSNQVEAAGDEATCIVSILYTVNTNAFRGTVMSIQCNVYPNLYIL